MLPMSALIALNVTFILLASFPCRLQDFRTFSVFAKRRLVHQCFNGRSVCLAERSEPLTRWRRKFQLYLFVFRSLSMAETIWLARKTLFRWAQTALTVLLDYLRATRVNHVYRALITEPGAGD